MAELRCRPIFNYSSEVSDNVKRIAEYYFIEGRNIIVDLLNPHYEKWNAEYTKEVSGEDDEEYNAYIQERQQLIIDMFNMAWNYPVTFFSDKYADIAAKINVAGEEVIMHMGIKLLNEEEWKRSLNN